MKAGNLDEANRIQAAIDEIKASTSVMTQKAIAGEYLYSSRRVSNSPVVLKPDGTISSDGHDWSMTWKVNADGYFELSDKNLNAVLVRTPIGWAGSATENNNPIAIVQK